MLRGPGVEADCHGRAHEAAAGIEPQCTERPATSIESAKVVDTLTGDEDRRDPWML